MDTAFFNDKILDNSIVSIFWFFVIIIFGLLLRKFVSNKLSGVIYGFLKKHVHGVDVQALRELLRKPIGLFIFLITFYIACKQLHYPPSWELPTEEKFGIRYIVWKGFQLSIVISLTWILLRLADFFALVLTYRSSLTASRIDDQLIPFIKESIKFVIISMSLFIMLGAIFDVNVASLIAGLGIGGLAFALAAKDTLENLLGSFTIFLDKPFARGDLVKVGSVFGKVEKIGFRSTQIRTFERTLITLPNKKMIDAELENISMRNMIRALFPLSLRMDTSTKLIEEFISKALKSIESNPSIHSDPAPFIRLEKITDTGIELQVLFFVETIDADKYQTVKQEILFSFLNIGQELGIRFDAKATEVVIRN
jgi:MscS family membrane protein